MARVNASACGVSLAGNTLSPSFRPTWEARQSAIVAALQIFANTRRIRDCGASTRAWEHLGDTGPTSSPRTTQNRVNAENQIHLGTPPHNLRPRARNSGAPEHWSAVRRSTV